MKNFYTRRYQRIYLGALGVCETVAVINWLAGYLGWSEGYELGGLFFAPVLPMWLLLFWLDDHKPPRIGDVRYRHVNEYRPIVWDGKQWVEGKEA